MWSWSWGRWTPVCKQTSSSWWKTNMLSENWQICFSKIDKSSFWAEPSYYSDLYCIDANDDDEEVAGPNYSCGGAERVSKSAPSANECWRCRYYLPFMTNDDDDDDDGGGNWWWCWWWSWRRGRGQFQVYFIHIASRHACKPPFHPRLKPILQVFISPLMFCKYLSPNSFLANIYLPIHFCKYLSPH